jgi:integrase/recombinase XerD
MPRPGEFGARRRLLAAPAHPESLAAWINRYLESLLVRGVRKPSAGTYRTDLAAFHEWCIERSIVRPGEVTKPILERWQRHLFYYRKADGQPMTMQRQVVMLHTVRLFFRWLARHNYIAANPASDLDLPRAPPRALPDVLSAAEAEAILAAFDVSNLAGLTGRAMAEVLYSTAIRRSELTNLQLYDLDAARQVVHIRHGKGGKSRMVPIGERALAWVQKYLDEARPELAIDPRQTALFVNIFGAPVTPSGLHSRMEEAKHLAGIQKRGSCHLFRHTAATLMLEHGADVRYIQEMLGHSNITTTELYTHVSIDKLKQVHAATHPGAPLKRRTHGLDADADSDALATEMLPAESGGARKRRVKGEYRRRT